MKNYNEQNYSRYRSDQDSVGGKQVSLLDYSRDELIIKFLPMVEKIARSFNTSDTSSGVLDVMDLIQYGSIGLISAVGKIDKDIHNKSDNPERSLKSFFAKRIKGAIRRSVDENRGAMKITEYKQNEIRRTNVGVELIFNSIFKSIDVDDSDSNHFHNMPDTSNPYNVDLLNEYLLNLMDQVLTYDEYHSVRLFYGLDCDRFKAKEVATYLGIKGVGANVRVSMLKKSAMSKLKEKINVEDIPLV